MRLGFGKIALLDAVDWPATTAVPPPSGESRNYAREKKFAISDRVAGLWRPEDGGPRRIVQPLHLAILYGEDAQGPFALVGLDHLEITYRDLDALRAPILAEYGISRERVVFLPSHGHVSVVYEPHKLRELITAAARQARGSATDVEMNAVTVRLDGRHCRRIPFLYPTPRGFRRRGIRTQRQPRGAGIGGADCRDGAAGVAKDGG
jgi:hypothetical protein